eukprot:778082-Prorocentrum_minimum.AAC.1
MLIITARTERGARASSGARASGARELVAERARARDADAKAESSSSSLAIDRPLRCWRRHCMS